MSHILSEIKIKLTVSCVLMVFSTSAIGEPPAPCKILQLFLKVSWDVLPLFPSSISYYMVLCIFFISNSDPHLRMPDAEGSVVHMMVAHNKCLWLPQITCCSDGNGPHSLWSLLSLASYFFLLPNPPSVDVTKSSKKSKLH